MLKRAKKMKYNALRKKKFEGKSAQFVGFTAHLFLYP